MKDVNSNNFGLLIAYLVPGFLALYGIRKIAPTIDDWLSANPHSSPTISGFLFGTIAALSTGMIINAIRWHVVDPLLYATGVTRKPWEYPRLAEEVPAFQFLITNQFRYYECYANSMVAIGISAAALLAGGEQTSTLLWVVFVLVQLVLWSASRRTLGNYNSRIASYLQRLDTESPSERMKIARTKSNEYIEKSSNREETIAKIDQRRTDAPTGIHSDN